MFDAMRSKFYKKSKSLLKLSKTRLETAKKKRFAVYQYLKNDLAELLRNGLDLNAYGRVEGFLAEQNMAFCYEYLQQCISTIYNQLSNMENQRECPSECREAVATLMHAAARFADLPEVRELRTVFTERYGSSLENFVSKEFVARLSPEAPSQERKIQIMEEVAQEFSILWDPRSLRKQLFKPAPPAQDKPVHRTLHDTDNDGYNKHKKKDDALPVRDSRDGAKKMNDVRVQDVPTSNRKKDAPYERYNVPSSREDNDNDGYNKHKKKDDALPVMDSRDDGKKMSDVRGNDVPTSNRRKDALYERYNLPSSSEDEVVSNHRRRDSSTSQDSQRTGSSSVGSSVSEDEVDSRKPVRYGLIRPPYVKQSNAKIGIEEPLRSNDHVNAEQTNYKDPPYVKSNSKLPPGREVAGNNLKPPPGREMAHKISPRLQSILSDGGNLNDEEEKKMDQLLMHYSKKKTYPPAGQDIDDTYGAARQRISRGNVYPPPGKQYEETNGTRHRNAKSEVPAAPARASSMPPEQNSIDEAAKKHGRANSLQPEMLAGHVHPKLPDYDDLAARLAALRGR
ncbi:hypothetical protein Pint_29840 [Pistacia integerrima]|uniref:Uncharacterized protein n=1 Tax=Pistacia integerrima TaxID=434235 RepID=A0ACC0X065_9ROSI|nr:hypothetical protein Pint_29840 [Pistacia integerrima]